MGIEITTPTVSARPSRGAPTNATPCFDSDFGNGTDDFVFCAYDTSGLVLEAELLGATVCATSPCWTDNRRAFSTRIATPPPTASRRLTGNAGAYSKAKLQVKGKGPNLRFLPPPYSWSGHRRGDARRRLRQTVLSATFTTPPHNDITQFSGKNN